MAARGWDMATTERSFIQKQITERDHPADRPARPGNGDGSRRSTGAVV